MPMTPVSQAMKILIGFYKKRELRLADELMKKHGYTIKQLAEIQEVSTEAARNYYKKRQ